MALVMFGHAGLSLIFLGKASCIVLRAERNTSITWYFFDAKSSCRRKTTENFWTLHVPHLCSLCGVSGTQVLGQPHYWLPGDVKGNKTPFQQETGKLTVWWYFLLYMQLDLCLLLTVAKLSFYAWGLMGFFADIEGYGKNSVANFRQCCLTRRY